MKDRYIILILFLGLFSFLAAAWAKITHQSWAQTSMYIAYAVIGLSVVVLLVKLFSKR